MSFTLAKGEVVALLGTSGCGKSTVLKMVAGLMRPTAGTIRLGDEEIVRPSRRIGIMFQQPTLLPWRTILDNILIQPEIRQGRRAALRHRSKAKELIALTGLSGFENALPSQLSGGMAQRAALCRMLVSEPELLLLDEPFGALDEFTREQMNVEFQRICAERDAAAIVVTHSIQEAVFLADRVLVMTPRPGKVAKSVDIDLPRPRKPEIMTGSAFNSYVAEIHSTLFDRQVHA
ncbi:ABC transporter ATP-binding protein [Microbacterium sp. MYb62]|uniref:ABC transporter ATP-binding protein n=1 Tax=Microbacterium sp. MYb62 TaxID=1848690 RepID=UPI001C611D4A|nr:ABC transporter ATP-binding protein [Microbacterium sp. MYb62]